MKWADCFVGTIWSMSPNLLLTGCRRRKLNTAPICWVGNWTKCSRMRMLQPKQQSWPPKRARSHHENHQVSKFLWLLSSSFSPFENQSSILIIIYPYICSCMWQSSNTNVRSHIVMSSNLQADLRVQNREQAAMRGLPLQTATCLSVLTPWRHGRRSRIVLRLRRRRRREHRVLRGHDLLRKG